MRLHLIYIVIVLANCYSVNGQNSNYFLYSDNKARVSNLIKTLKKENQKHHKEYLKEPRKVRISQSGFLNMSLYSDFELLNSGFILFNKELDSFFNEIKQIIISNNNVTDFNIYALNSSQINAFASDNGNIYFTLGLLSRLKTEAQVAAILCHELSHFQLKHNIKGFTNKLKAKLNLDSFMKDLSVNFKDIEYHNYSQILELEADSLGFIYHLNSGYNPTAFIDVFDILSKSGLPAQPGNFGYTVPVINFNFKKYFDSSITDIINLDSAKSYESVSHPSLSEREKLVNMLLAQIEAEKNTSVDFTIPKSKFEKLIIKVNYTLVETFNIENLPIEGLCHVHSVKQNFENDEFIDGFELLYFLQVSQTEFNTQQYKYDDYNILKNYSNNINANVKAAINFLYASSLVLKHNSSEQIIELYNLTKKSLEENEVISEEGLKTLLTDEGEDDLIGLVEENIFKRVVKIDEPHTNNEDYNGICFLSTQAFVLNEGIPSLLNAKKSIKYNKDLNLHAQSLIQNNGLNGMVLSLNTNSDNWAMYYDQIRKIKAYLLNRSVIRVNTSIMHFSSANYYEIEYFRLKIMKTLGVSEIATIKGVVYTGLDYQNRFLSWSYGGLLTTLIPQGAVRTLMGPAINNSQCEVKLKVYSTKTGTNIGSKKIAVRHTSATSGTITQCFEMALYNYFENK
ncbi:MAG: M48 family metallopeptidase [Bacteroidia bacterium]